MTESFKSPKITWEVLKSQTEAFSEKLHYALEQLGITENCLDLEIDHICVRLQSNSHVDNLKNQLIEVGQVISSANVNGREISIIQLIEPLNLGAWKVSGVELPHPKPIHTYTDGFEHVEFVLAGAPNTMDGVREAFMDKFAHLDRHQLESEYSYSEDEPHAGDNEIPNPTISLKVNGVGIKFHANSIQTVVGFKE